MTSALAHRFHSRCRLLPGSPMPLGNRSPDSSSADERSVVGRVDSLLADPSAGTAALCEPATVAEGRGCEALPIAAPGGCAAPSGPLARRFSATRSSSNGKGSSMRPRRARPSARQASDRRRDVDRDGEMPSAPGRRWPSPPTAPGSSARLWAKSCEPPIRRSIVARPVTFTPCPKGLMPVSASSRQSCLATKMATPSRCC